jgi:hypothetical protein
MQRMFDRFQSVASDRVTCDGDQMCNCSVTNQVLRLYFQRLNYPRAQLAPKICEHLHYWTTIFSLLIDDTTTSPDKG